MTMTGASLRFLALALSAWVGVRVWSHDGHGIDPARLTPRFATADAAMAAIPHRPIALPHPVAAYRLTDWTAPAMRLIERLVGMRGSRSSPDRPAPRLAYNIDIADTVSMTTPRRRLFFASATVDPADPAPAQDPDAAVPPRISRWSGSSWLLMRNGAPAATIATAGQIGGSQTGLRLRWRINPEAPIRTALSMRLSTPLADYSATEASLGAEWHPLPGRQLWLGVDRRIALGGNARNAWAAQIAGGFWRPGLPYGLVAEGYGQAGVIGLHRRQGFVDGALRVSRPLGRPDGARAGVGLWGAAQPGVTRLDIGPQLVFPLRIAHRNITATVEGRLRVAGQAAPGSGVALTLGSDF